MKMFGSYIRVIIKINTFSNVVIDVTSIFITVDDLNNVDIWKCA